MLVQLADHFAGMPITVVCDSWFGNNGLFKPVREILGTHFICSPDYVAILCFTLRRQNIHRDSTADHASMETDWGRLPKWQQGSKQRHQVIAYFSLWAFPRGAGYYKNVLMLKTLKCPARVVWVFRKTQWTAFFSTDLGLSIKQIIEYYGARWRIESGFKEIKQEIGSSKSQTHSAHAVINHINFSMMAATVTWIYGARLENIPKRRHKVRGRNSFAFPDLRRIIAKAALSEDFDAVCGNHLKTLKKLFVQ